MIRIIYYSGIAVSKDSAGFFKGNFVLGDINQILLFVPLKLYIIHNYIITTYVLMSNRSKSKQTNLCTRDSLMATDSH